MRRLAGALLAAFVLLAPAEATDPAKVPAPPQPGLGPAPTPPALPNLRVHSVWLGSGSGDRFAPLGGPPHLGEKISLVCDVRVTGTPPSGWKLAWYIDGAQTCGEGEFTTEPDCQFAWSLSGGGTAFIDWVPRAAGPHSFSCRADIDNAVTESRESDNASRIAFTVGPKRVHPPSEPLPKTLLRRSPPGVRPVP